MRYLTFNGESVDIDEKTAIGLTIQTYDLKEPAKRKITISNTFTIPKTAKNLYHIGFAGSPHLEGHKVYDLITCDYWIDNEQLITNARVRIDEVSDRISCFVYQKADIWEEIKTYNWKDFTEDLLEWLQDEKGIPGATSPYYGTLTNFLNTYINATSKIVLPFYFSNMVEYVAARPAELGTGNLEGKYIYAGQETNHIFLNYPATGGQLRSLGGHFCVYIQTIFEFLEYKYSVNFITGGGGALGNIWDDQYATKIYIPIRNLDIYNAGVGGNTFYFRLLETGTDDAVNAFLPLTNQADKNDKTVYDLVNAFFQKFNIIKDEIYLSDGSEAIRLARFDDIKTKAAVKNWSGRISGTPKFKPFVEGFGQNNIIKAASVYPQGDSMLNARTIVCKNKNLDPTVELFQIDEYIPAITPIAPSGTCLDLSTSESFSTFEFLINSGTVDCIVWLYDEAGNVNLNTTTLNKSALYSLNGEYTFFDEILEYPKFFEIEKWLTIYDVKDIEFFKQYYIKELGGSFFINKISGFNPQKSNSPTKIELIKISNKTAQPEYAAEYYTDGMADPFIDGAGNYLY